MPSKHTVVVSLDEETEKILDNLSGNRSEWIREAIRLRAMPESEVEILEALCEARAKRVRWLSRIGRRVVKLLEVEDTSQFAPRTHDAINELHNEVVE